MENLAIVMPARNEAEKIRRVIESIRSSCRGCHIIVVDDGSSDSTSEVARSLGCEVHRLDKNRGKGYACRLGAEKAKAERIVFIDADGQFFPEEIPRLAEKLGECDIVIGSRDWGAVPVQRRLSNSFSRRVLNSAAKSKYRDVLCGFRAVRKGPFMRLGLEKDRYEFEAEMLIKAARKGLRVCEIPVKVRYLDYPGMPLTQSLKLAFYIIGQRIRIRKSE
jgi:glycosyltransferase involved in cell wall biosynthesis